MQHACEETTGRFTFPHNQHSSSTISSVERSLTSGCQDVSICHEISVCVDQINTICKQKKMSTFKYF